VAVIRRKTMAFKPLCRMDPPPRSFAADAHDCIMVRSSRIDRIQGCGAISASDRELPSELSSFPRAAGKLIRPTQSAAVLVTVKGKSLRDSLRPPLTVTARGGQSRSGRGEEMVTNLIKRGDG
jgi:hypothetical protein